MKALEYIKENNLIDERNIWISGSKKGIISDNISFFYDMYYLTVKEDTLLIIKNFDKNITIEAEVSKKDISNIKCRYGLFHLDLNFRLESKNYNETFIIRGNKKIAFEIKKILNK